MNTVTYDVSDRGTWCNQEVAGENAYAATFRKLTKTEAKVSRNEWNCDVTLVPEPDNPYSKRRTAISVRWRDQVVGYLPETDCHRYQQLRRITASGLQAQTHARVWKGDYRENFYSITISLPEPDLVVPLNDPPSSGFALLPQGGSVQVTKESDHLDVLAEFVPPSGLGLLLVTLHEIEQGIRTRWLGLEVRLDGERIGELTKASSGKLLGAVQSYREQGLETVCRAKIQGSSVAAEVTLFTKWAHELTEAELSPVISPLPRLVDYEPDPSNYEVPRAYKRSSVPKPPKRRPATRPKRQQPEEHSPHMPEQRWISTPPPADQHFPPAPPVVGMPSSIQGTNHQPTSSFPNPPYAPGEFPQSQMPQTPVTPESPQSQIFGPNPHPANAPLHSNNAPPNSVQQFKAQIPQGPSPVPSEKDGHKTPIGRAILSGVGVALGALFVAISFAQPGARDKVACLLLGLAMLVPSSWWFYCNSQDKKRIQEHRRLIGNNRHLARMLGDDHPQVASGLDVYSQVQPFRRRWIVVAPLSILLFISFVAMVPAEGM